MRFEFKEESDMSVLYYSELLSLTFGRVERTWPSIP